MGIVLQCSVDDSLIQFFALAGVGYGKVIVMVGTK